MVDKIALESGKFRLMTVTNYNYVHEKLRADTIR
jgi:hypothetical protein